VAETKTGRPPLEDMTMVNKFKVPTDVVEVYREVSEETGIPQARLMRDALAQYADEIAEKYLPEEK
jgi:predicted DNA-binding protein